MGWNFRKSKSLLGGLVRVTASKQGLGVSVGKGGVRVSSGPGGSRATVSLGRTGLRYVLNLGRRRR